MALREVFAQFTTRFNGTALQRGAQQVGGLTSRIGGAMGAARALGAAFHGLAIVQIIQGWISAAASFVSEIITVGDELDKTSRALGIGTTALQEWQHAAGLSGIGASEFTGSLRRLGANMNTAVITPTSAAAIEFRRLGVQLRGPDGQLRDMSDVMMDMADPISQMGSNSQRVATLTALLGRQGARLGPMFEQGRAGVEAMRAELEELGGGASPEMIQQSADLTDAYARLDLATLSIKSRLATILIPVVEAAVDAFTDLTAWLARHEEVILVVEVALWSLLVAFGALVAFIVIASIPIWGITLVIMGLVALAFMAVVVVVQDMIVWFQGGTSVIGTFVDALLALAGLSMAGLRDQIAGLFEELRTGYNSLAETLGLPTISAGGDSSGPVTTTDAKDGGDGSATSASGSASGSRETFGQGVLARLRRVGGEGTSRGAFAALTEDRRPTNQTVTQTTAINITGANPQDIAESVRRVMDGSNREAIEALGQ